jgi:hypothetical protein
MPARARSEDDVRSKSAQPSKGGINQGNFWVLFGSIWLLVGLPFLLGPGYFILQERQLATNGLETEGIVVTKEVGRSGDSVHRKIGYRFTADGQTFEGTSEVSEERWNSVTERGPVPIEYLPGRPAVSRVVGASELTLLLIFSFVGLLLSIAGGTIVFVSLRRARTTRRLLTSGVRADASVTEVEPMNLRVNGRPQWRLKYEYRDHRSRQHVGSMYLDGEEAERWKAGDAGIVLFDPDRPATAVWLGTPENAA